MNYGTRTKMRLKYHCLVGFFVVVALIIVVIHLPARPKRDKGEETVYEEEVIAASKTALSCNLFSGRWVFDNVSYPLYKEGQCSFMLNGYNDYACQKYGRMDVKYQNWRWQPDNCDLPRFDGKALLEKIRGKRLVFVGDSLNKNQWTSMLCLIESSLHQSSPKSVIRNDNLFIFQATEYNATIEYYWSPFLVESNCDDPFNHSIKSDRVIKVTAIEKHARRWTDADILIFDAFMWWRAPTMVLLWGSFEDPNAIYKKVEMRLRRYEMALNTWSDWLEININRNKTKLFFMSQSSYHTAYHMYGESGDTQHHCYNETQPITKGFRGITTDRDLMHLAESVIEKLESRGLNIEYLNITHLSDYRKDAHPSIYKNFFRPPSEMQLANPKSYADCVHWCLPGVPDIWNEILYSYIINS